MRARFTRLAAAALGAALLAGPLATGASAHERRNVGPVTMVVGWLNEPAYTGFYNAVQLRLSDAAGPITDVGDNLRVEVTFGDQRVGPLALAPAFGSPGEYRAPLVPTRPGTYTFRFVGTVRGQQVDQAFTSSDTTFDSPESSGEIEFPVRDPSRGDLAARLERVDPRIDGLAAEADDARSAANRATLLAVAGLVAGVAGLAIGLSARRRGGPEAAAAPASKASTGV